jgi:hypothetical protein
LEAGNRLQMVPRVSRFSTPLKIGATAQPTKAIEEHLTEAKTAPGANITPEKSKQDPLLSYLISAKK